MKECVDKRTRNFKVYHVEGKRFKVSGQMGWRHFRADEEDEHEPWKDIYREYDGQGKFLGTPVLTAEMDPSGYPAVTIKHRKSKDEMVLHLCNGNGNEDHDSNWGDDEGFGRVWKGGYFGFKCQEGGTIKVAYTIESALSPHTLKLKVGGTGFKWLGDKYDPEQPLAHTLFTCGKLLFTPFVAFDGKKSQVEGENYNGWRIVPLAASYDSGLLTLEVTPPPDAVYPIVIDPTGITTEQVGASTDDAYQTSFVNTGTALHYWNNQYMDLWCGERWQTVPVPAGATINSATITVYVIDTTDDNPECLIYFQNGDAAAFSEVSDTDITDRTRTGSSTTWSTTDVGSGWVESPDLATPLGQVITDGDWAEDYNLAAIIDGRPGNVANKTLYVRMWDYTGNAHGAKFDCDYTESGGSGTSHRRWGRTPHINNGH